MFAAFAIRFSESRQQVNITINFDTANYVLSTAVVPYYKIGLTDLTVTVNTGVVISSSSVSKYAFTVDTSWSPYDSLTIINNGIIVGKGGSGGVNYGGFNSPGGPGTNGGPAMLIQTPVSINNLNGTIGGGGGGGGAAGSPSPAASYFVQSGGGGGGAGYGLGGATGYYYQGQPGTATQHGSHGVGYAGVVGGDGGDLGHTGYPGQQGANGGASGGDGGEPGACLVGNNYITWLADGIRLGLPFSYG